MSFTRKNDTLHVEALPLSALAAEFGTPTYVYSKLALEFAYREYADYLAAHPAGKGALVCFAIKANSNIAILQTFARLGAGFDIVSGGELRRVLHAGAEASKVVFSGVGKTADEMAFALEKGIRCFNIESASELERLSVVATKLGKKAPISLRVNPDVDAKTHPYISTGLKENKFGVAFAEARQIYRRASELPGIAVLGIDCHIGSQILEIAPFIEALDKLLGLIDQLAEDGITLEHLDLGGGLGIRYQEGQQAPAVADYLAPLLDRLQTRNQRHPQHPLSLVFEPGRRLVGNAGCLLTRVEYLKHGDDKHFAIVDAAMNDLMRPALYDAWHDIEAVTPRGEATKPYDIVGPICESGDFLGHSRALALQEGDLLAIMSAGAYGMAMSSNYNSRPRAAEVLVEGTRAHLVRQREHFAALWADERLLP
jgi:diaminopimelate decarboxylase